jgi:MEMO1 family protein
LVQENHDDLKWCGSAPIYTFLKAAPRARGQLHRYQQWNIDEQSVVSFAAIGFRSY